MIKQQTQQTRQPLLVALGLAASSAMLVLTACGGGGGGGAGTPTTTIDPAALKGRWVTPAGAASAMTAVVVPDASGKVNAWLLAQDASRLVKLVVGSDSSAKGQSYALSPSANGQAVTGQVTTTLTATPKRISFTGVNTAALAFDQNDTLAASAVQADAAGAWGATAGDKARVTSWTVASTGGITGSTTTGCSYTGQLAAMTGTTAYSAQFEESCSDNTKTTFNGIATIDGAKTRMTVTAVTADQTRGVAVFFAKK